MNGSVVPENYGETAYEQSDVITAKASGWMRLLVENHNSDIAKWVFLDEFASGIG